MNGKILAALIRNFPGLYRLDVRNDPYVQDMVQSALTLCGYKFAPTSSEEQIIAQQIIAQLEK